MTRIRPPYSPEFRRKMVDLLRNGRYSKDLARTWEPTTQSIGAWVAGWAISEQHELSAPAAREQASPFGAGNFVKSRGLVCTESWGCAARLFRFMSAKPACCPITPMARVLGAFKARYYARVYRPPSAHANAPRRC